MIGRTRVGSSQPFTRYTMKRLYFFSLHSFIHSFIRRSLVRYRPFCIRVDGKRYRVGLRKFVGPIYEVTYQKKIKGCVALTRMEPLSPIEKAETIPALLSWEWCL